MITLALQCLVDLLTLMFAAIGFLVVRRTRSEACVQREMWFATSLMFGLLGISSTLQEIGAVRAFVAGPGTDAYSQYLVWSPIGNHSRNAMVVVYAATILALAGREMSSFQRIRRFMLLGFPLAMLGGGLIGVMEGPLLSGYHLSAFAVFTALGFLGLLGALMVSLLNRAMDWLLWLCIGIYSVHSVFDVLWYSALAWVSVPGAWVPSFAEVQLIGAIAYALMIVVALRRLSLARRAVPVGGILEPPAAAAPSLLV